MVLRTWRRSRRGTDDVAPSAATPPLAVDADPARPPDPEPVPDAVASEVEVAVEIDRDIEAILAEADELASTDGPLVAIDRLRAANRTVRDERVDARVLHLRHEAYESLPHEGGRAEWPPRVDDRFAGVEGCPEVGVDDLDADTLASAVVNHGCLLVRGLVPPETAQELVDTIDRSFLACDERGITGAGSWPTSWYHPFRPMPGYPAPKEGHRGWVRSAGGVLAADSPPAFETMVSAFETAGLREVIGGYLGEHPILSVDKCTLRRVPLTLGGAEWHQDGSFLGDGIRTLNVWLALSPCGGDLPSPGLDLVPRRFDEVLPTGSDGAFFDWSVGPELVERLAVETPVIRPVFEAGDALLFDDLFLHRTALAPTMTEERYAIESWFFADSTYPGSSIPIVF
jgi:hypothetical protein